MASPNSHEPDPLDQVISMSTTEVSTASPQLAPAPAAAPAPVATPGAAGAAAATGPTAGRPAGDDSPAPPDSEGPEAEVWESRYALGNFAGRFILGAFLIAVSSFFTYYGYETGHAYTRPLAILSGLVASCFWLWLVFRIVRARFSHYYRLTTRRLFVTVGIFRRQQDIMELNDLKEVTLQQQKFLDHVFKIGTVVVASKVGGAPTLFLVGVKYPQQVSDQIYLHARN